MAGSAKTYKPSTHQKSLENGQEGIDEELFDVVSGYQALSGESPPNL